MAELLLIDDWAEPGSLEVHLREVLPDGYFIVADLTVRGQPLDAVVVGPQGLVVLYARDWEGWVHPSPRGPWRQHLESGEQVRLPSPAGEVAQATEALRDFLQDEFPSLRPAIYHLLVLTKPQAKSMATEATEPLVVTQEGAAEAITALESRAGGLFLDAEVRESLARALRERRLTVSQRASEPFVFRSGGVFGSGKKVWTIQAAVRHMDRHPEDGMFHLHNGTLARWLSEQRAEHLATLAREVMRERYTNPRVPLESFLIGTGLVRRPRLSVQPRRVNLGCALSGQASQHRMRVRKGRGRGYLFGSLATSEPWLRVEPASFDGSGLEAVVSADTELLAISRKPWRADILVDSNASEEPVPVPARVRVVGMPSGLNRYLLRPLVGAASAGLLGAVLGWALGRWGLRAPGWYGELAALSASWAAACAAWVGLFWAILGAIRGLLQPVAWPITYATGRWLQRTLVWAVALSLVSVVGHWVWPLVRPDLGPGVEDATTASVLLLALCLSIVPAVVGEIGSASRAKAIRARPARRPVLRPLLLAAAGIALVLVLVAGLVLLGPIWQQANEDGTVASAEEGAVEQWTEWEAGFNDFVDQLMIRYYDRRAPAGPAPGPTPLLTPSPAAGAGTP